MVCPWAGSLHHCSVLHSEPRGISWAAVLFCKVHGGVPEHCACGRCWAELGEDRVCPTSGASGATSIGIVAPSGAAAMSPHQLCFQLGKLSHGKCLGRERGFNGSLCHYPIPHSVDEGQTPAIWGHICVPLSPLGTSCPIPPGCQFCCSWPPGTGPFPAPVLPPPGSRGAQL